LNRGQEFVIGGFVPGANGVESIIVGYYQPGKLIYVAKIKNCFVPLTRRGIFEKLTKMVTAKCPFVNLPEIHKGGWGQGLTARRQEDMKKCVWVRPKLVAQIEFLEWTPITFDTHVSSRFAMTKIRGLWSTRLESHDSYFHVVG
jgi:ATP-dependent DNA ligase